MAAATFADFSLDGPQIGTLVIVVDRAKNLPNRKTTKQDPYCQARLGKTCNKTKTDRRGGQTPRWDEELRFTVLDAPDYYTLKLSVFNDDKKTDLIGDAFVDLTQVIVPGGGQSDKWQELECRKKYAGEVRIELTYYDSRPKIEKPAPPRRESIRPVGEEEAHVSGPRQYTPVKRRPLPSNPGSANSDPHRFHAGGPRDYGTPQPHSGDHTPGSHSFARQLPQIDAGLPGDGDPYFQHDAIDAQQDYHYGMDNAATGAQEPEMFQPDSYIPHASDPAAFLPALPPTNRNGHANDYDGDMRYELPNAFTAPPHESFSPHQEYPVDTALTHPDVYHSDTGLDPFSPQPVHQSQAALMQLEHRYDVDLDPYANGNGQGMHDNFDPNDHLLDDSTFQNEPEGFDVPPPPPVHGGGSALSRALPNSSPGYSNYDRWNPQENSWQGDDWQSPHAANARGHLTSQSEACLARYVTQPDDFQPLDVEPPQRRSLNATFQSDDGTPAMPMSSTSPVAPRRHSGSSPSDLPVDPYTGSPHSERSYELVRHSRKNSYQSPNIYDSSSYHRKSLSQAQSCPLPNSSPLGSPPHYGTQAQHVHTPTRPHPLSQQHIPSSSPHDHSPSLLLQSQYDPIPIIKPLAIAPNKSKASTPGSQPRAPRPQGRSPIVHRKSVSPHPLSNDGSPFFGTPYSPDDYDVLNPAVAALKASRAESVASGSSSIVDFHGNNIDPSDRLPESTWAPEPAPKLPPGIDPSDHLPASTWAPEPATSTTATSTPTRAAPRRTVVRLRDVPRPLNQRGAEPPRQQRHSMYAAPPAPLFSGTGAAKQPGGGGGSAGASPTGASPTGRNRLVKRNPAAAVTAAAAAAAPPYVAAGRPASMVGVPPVPAKVPLDAQERVWENGFGAGYAAEVADMDRLSRELQSIDIGGVGRRVNGRRLLGFKDV